MYNKLSLKSFCCFTTALFLLFSAGCHVVNSGSWETVFSDNFNRADGDLGSQWNVTTSPNASVSISNNQVLYNSNTASDNDLYCTYVENISGTRIKLSSKIITDSEFSDVNAAGFVFQGYPYNSKVYSLTFNNSFFAFGSTNKETEVTSWIRSIEVDISEDTTYYLELNIDGSGFTGCIKDSSDSILYKITVVEKIFSLWTVGFLFETTTENTTVKIDDFEIQSFFKSED